MKKIQKFLLMFLFLLLPLSLVACGENKKAIDPGPLPPVDNNFDVIVLGGEPEGVAAAVSASRNGATVLLVEKNESLGGLMTLGRLNFLDMNHNNGTLLTEGIFKEFYDAVGGTAFDVEEAKKTFLKMVDNQRSIVLKLNADFLEPIKDDNTLTGIKILEDGEEKEYFAKVLIDATADADLAAASGVPYTIAGEDIGEKDRMMGVTLVFEVTDVEWDKVVNYLKNDGNENTGADKKSAWGYTEEGFSYEPKDDLMRLRGFNAARQENGNVLVNALVIFGVDVLDEDSKKEGIARAKKELEYIMPYVNENFIGFENAKLVDTAEQLYVRESRHIIGEYQLTIDDVLENRDQWDRIALGGYPVDVQPTEKQRWGTIVGVPKQYSIPFRSLVPLEVENLLVVGKCASFKSLAAGSARVIPVGMCTAEAAGLAAIYSIENDLTVRELSRSKEDIKKLQKSLIAQGAYLPEFEIRDKNMDHWAYEGLKIVRSLGLLDGGYNNDYRLDEEMGKWRYQNLLNRALEKAGKKPEVFIEVSLEPTNAEILTTAYYGLTGEKKDAEFARAYLQEKAILTELLEPYFSDLEKKPQAAEVTYLVANIYEYLTKNK